MNTKQFNALLRERQSLEREILVTKAGEYANDYERFANFHNAAPLQASGCTPEAALWNMVVKHIIATRDAINQINLGITMPLPFWDEKLGDIRNYMILLEGLIKDRIEMEKKNV